MAPPVSPLPSMSPPSALTSASWGKRKASALESDGNTPSSKRSRPPSVTAKVQPEGSAAISSLTTVMQEISKHLATPTPIPVAPVLPAAPPSDFACTVEVLSSATNISDEDKLEMMPLF
ncbi:hypothetical protein BDR03DRAFT_1005807 [Suillus americanus]|nr:hypothetical protein BDR03DRAFT_1005807 [Suillus americanus]